MCIYYIPAFCICFLSFFLHLFCNAQFANIEKWNCVVSLLIPIIGSSRKSSPKKSSFLFILSEKKWKSTSRIISRYFVGLKNLIVLRFFCIENYFKFYLRGTQQERFVRGGGGEGKARKSYWGDGAMTPWIDTLFLQSSLIWAFPKFILIKKR